MSGAVSRTLLILTAGACAMAVPLALLPAAGHDQLWLVLAARRMLNTHTANPYGPTVFESNPPLAIWLSAIVVALANLLHLSVTIVFKLSVTLVAALSAWLSARLLRRLSPTLTPANWIFLAFAFLLIFGAIPARDFGQRDHILTLLILPYLVAASIRLRSLDGQLGTTPRILLTLLAALGIALKPHQTLIPIAVELTLLLYPRLLARRLIATNAITAPTQIPPMRLRLIEPAVFLLAALTYYAAIRHFAPTYLLQILPTLRDTYWAFGSLSLIDLQLASWQLQLLLLLTLTRFASRLARQPEAIRPIVPILLAAAIAAGMAYIAQGTGWYYQQLPALSLFALVLAFQLIDLTHRKPLPTPRWLPAATAAFVLFTLALTTWASDFHRTPHGILQPQPIPDPAFFATLPAGTAVATLTTSVDDTVEPAFLYHLTLAQRYPHLWLLPAILRNQAFLAGTGPRPQRVIPRDRLATLIALQRRMMVEDLTLWHPQLILVARCEDPAIHCQVLEDRHDNLLAFFLADPAFAALFSHYHPTRSSGPYAAYKLTTNH